MVSTQKYHKLPVREIWAIAFSLLIIWNSWKKEIFKRMSRISGLDTRPKPDTDLEIQILNIISDPMIFSDYFGFFFTYFSYSTLRNRLLFLRQYHILT